MQLPGVNASSSVHLIFAYHVEGGVEAWADVEVITDQQQKEVTAVGAVVAPLVTGLRGAVQASDDAERAAAKARARFRVRDVVLDLRIMGVSDSVLNGPALRNRASPFYVGIFAGDNAGDITRARIRDEPELAALLLARLDKADDFAGKAAARDALDDAVKKSIAARDALDDADLAESKAGDAELAARLALRMGLEKAYGLLRAAFTGRRDFVESFFPKADRGGSKEADAPGAPPAPDGSGGGAGGGGG